MDDLLNYSEILVKEPFYEVMPKGYKAHRTVYRGQRVSEPTDRLQMRILTQADFLRQFYPSGHKIMDPVMFPDIYKYNPDTGQYFKQPVTRTAFAYQRVLYVKQTVHVCGNDVQFELSGKTEDEDTERQKQIDLLDFRQGWLDMDMELRLYEAVSSEKITGDCALVCYYDKDGNAQMRSLSYLNGDTLYPHYDSITGEMNLFARRYSDLDEDGRAVTEWVEVWDDRYIYRAKRGISKHNIIERIKDVFGLSGYTIVSQEEHGFPFVPVAYHRNPDGPCWIFSQNTIEQYEEAFSYLCESNKAYAFPIMYSKGDGVEFKPDELTGAVKYIEMPNSDAEAGFLDKTDVAPAFNTQLSLMYDAIFEQSFGVKPPELKSGDLPGVAIKLLYSPAIELAIHDAHRLLPFLNRIVYMVKYAYGFQINRQASLLNLNVNAWIEPYVHQNDSELMANLAMGVQNSFISHQTASERASKYTKNDEIDRVMREDMQKRKLDAQAKIDEQRAAIEMDIEKQKALARITKGQDVNTGQGKGRPNRSGKTWDKNGNNPIDDKNNWNKWNSAH